MNNYEYTAILWSCSLFPHHNNPFALAIGMKCVVNIVVTIRSNNISPIKLRAWTPCVNKFSRSYCNLQDLVEQFSKEMCRNWMFVITLTNNNIECHPVPSKLRCMQSILYVRVSCRGFDLIWSCFPENSFMTSRLYILYLRYETEQNETRKRTSNELLANVYEHIWNIDVGWWQPPVMHSQSQNQVRCRSIEA